MCNRVLYKKKNEQMNERKKPSCSFYKLLKFIRSLFAHKKDFVPDTLRTKLTKIKETRHFQTSISQRFYSARHVSNNDKRSLCLRFFVNNNTLFESYAYSVRH